MLMRGLLPAIALMTAPALAQTQATRQSARQATPSIQSARPVGTLRHCYTYLTRNPDSPCFNGAPNRSNSTTGFDGSANIDEEQAKSLIYGRGYLDVSRLTKDQRGIWRGVAMLEDGRPVSVVLDQKGNIYSTPRELPIQQR
jgi:hypothetical protein